MKYVEIRKGLTIPEIAVGLMRIDSVGVEGTEKLINKALELGTELVDLRRQIFVMQYDHNASLSPPKADRFVVI